MKYSRRLNLLALIASSMLTVGCVSYELEPEPAPALCESGLCDTIETTFPCDDPLMSESEVAQCESEWDATQDHFEVCDRDIDRFEAFAALQASESTPARLLGLDAFVMENDSDMCSHWRFQLFNEGRVFFRCVGKSEGEFVVARCAEFEQG